MELNREELKKRAEAIKAGIIKFVQTAQGEINALQAQLQDKIRDAQKHVDQQEGKLAGLNEVIGPDEKPPGKPSNVIALPDRSKSPPTVKPDAPKAQ